MQVKQHIPNLLTLGNLACGVMSIVLLFEYHGENKSLLIASLFGAALVCDFLDGFAARLLKVASPIGKQLDSLADMVTFGVLPGIMVFQMTEAALSFHRSDYLPGSGPEFVPAILAMSFILIPLFSALRLAKFNVDERQTVGFIGLPTPANAVFFASLYLWQQECLHSGITGVWRMNPSVPGDQAQSVGCWETFAPLLLNPWLLAGLAVLFSLLLVSPLRLMALKFKSFSFGDNWTKYLLIASGLVILPLLNYKGVPLLILLYFALSILDSFIHRKNEI